MIGRPGLSIQRVPRTKTISTVVQSPAWASAISRMLVEPFDDRKLEAFLAFDDLAVRGSGNLRAVTVVEMNAESCEAACELAIMLTSKGMHGKLFAISIELSSRARHALQVCGYTAVFDSMTDLERLEKMVRGYFAGLPCHNLPIETAVELALPWPEFSQK